MASPTYLIKNKMEKFRFNNRLLRGRRKELRAKETEAEEKLWLFIKNKEFHGLKFYRQYSVGGYILDFYCPKLRLGIELDGNQHKERETILYDKDREKYLGALSIRVIRFWNNEVINDIEKVLEKIILEIK
jgi:very-short-patch-repair endonuclease